MYREGNKILFFTLNVVWLLTWLLNLYTVLKMLWEGAQVPMINAFLKLFGVFVPYVSLLSVWV
jgi:hypothetical protein